MRRGPRLELMRLSPTERERLQQWIRRRKTANMGYLDENNDNRKPFVWTKTADEIIEAVGRFCTDISDSAH